MKPDLNNKLLPFLKALKELFYLEMGGKTSACLYGSAATGNWVSTRSDLDLFVFLQEKELQLFGKKIKIWQSRPACPRLDGDVVFASSNILMSKRIDKFDELARPATNAIQLIDLWNIKNHSVDLFGRELKSFVREITTEELKDWAIKHIDNFWMPLMTGVQRTDTSGAKIPLSTLVWTASGVARTLMLTKGNICNSKKDALSWLASECVEVREMINIFLEEYEKPDDVGFALSTNQAIKLGRVYLSLFRKVRR